MTPAGLLQIGVQVQYDDSFHWDVYDEMVRRWTRAEVEDLEAFERQALWLQTPAGGCMSAKLTIAIAALPAI
jgi:hypothetical protein